MVALACALIVKTIAKTIWDYRLYVPPDFASEFLRGREGHFRGVYQWMFYAHILAGPVALLLGLLLIVERARPRLPAWHRRLGWFQVGCVVLLVAPTGLWMAFYAAGGPVAGVSLASLAVATAASAALGARAAARRRFADHRIWMWRCYILLCSAVALRVLGGLAIVAGMDARWFDPLATWTSWLAPLSVFELVERSRRRRRAGERARLRPEASGH
jgi:hypothetical protein